MMNGHTYIKLAWDELTIYNCPLKKRT